MSETQPPKLEYAIEKPPSWHQRNHGHIRRFLAGVIAAIAGFTLCRLGLKQWEDWKEYQKFQRLEQACNKYSPPATQVVVDDDPADFKTLLASDPHYMMSGNEIIYVPPVWFQPGEGCPPLVENMEIFYYGYRKTRAGTHQLVVCFWLGGDVSSATISLAKFGEPPRWHYQQQSDIPIIRAASQHLKVFAGQSDPSDGSHFTIAYTLGNTPGTIDGWLQDDESVKLQLRQSPATARDR